MLVNRRDYPDSVPFNEKELLVLSSAKANTQEAAASVRAYMKARARELHDFLLDFVTEEGIAADSLVIAGWSFGSAFILALLAHATTFSTNGVELGKYIRRVIVYGAYTSSSGLLTSFEGLGLKSSCTAFD